MRKQNYILVALLFFGLLAGSSSVLSQSRGTIARTALSRMDVLSRAELFEQTIADAARKEGVDPLILWTIAYNETRFRPWLTSPRNAQGMMQFIPAMAKRFGLTNPYEPNASIHAASRYVKYLGGLFNWRLDSIFAAYNAGEGTVMAYLHGRKLISGGKVINASGRQTRGGIPPYRETMNYVSQGTKVYRWLETQSKFVRSSIDRTSSTNQPEFQDPTASEKKSSASASVLTVLYDPRTGKRFRVVGSGESPLQTIDQDGPVIVSPDLRSLPAGTARSTFAGVNKP